MNTPSKPTHLLITEVCDRTRLSKPTIYKLINRGNFPKQIKLSAHRVVWLAAEIDGWLLEKATARTAQNVECSS